MSMNAMRATTLALAALAAAIPGQASAASIQRNSPIATGANSLEVAGLAAAGDGRPSALLVDRSSGRMTLWRGNDSGATVSRTVVATVPFGIRPVVLRAAGRTGLVTYWREYRGNRERMVVAHGDRLQNRQRFDGYDVVDLATAPDGRAALLLRKGRPYASGPREFAVSTRPAGSGRFGAPVSVDSAISGQVAVGRDTDVTAAALVTTSGVSVVERSGRAGSFTTTVVGAGADAQNPAIGIGEGMRITIAWTRSVIGGRQLVAATRRAPVAVDGVQPLVAFTPADPIPVKVAALDAAPALYVSGKRDGVVWAGDFGTAGIYPIVSSRGSGAWSSYFRTDTSPADRHGVVASEPFSSATGVAATIAKSGRVKIAGVGATGSSRFRTLNGSRNTFTLPYVASGGGSSWVAITESRGARRVVRVLQF